MPDLPYSEGTDKRHLHKEPNMVKYSSRLDVNRIVHNISCATAWLSVSTRGVESAVEGICKAIKQTVRGLTLTLTNGKKVVWSCPAGLAHAVCERVDESQA